MNINKYIQKHSNKIDEIIDKNIPQDYDFDPQLSNNEIKVYLFISYCSNYLKKIINSEFNFFASSLKQDSKYVYNNLKLFKQFNNFFPFIINWHNNF